VRKVVFGQLWVFLDKETTFFTKMHQNLLSVNKDSQDKHTQAEKVKFYPNL
jgi:hypothetical protein